ncbi:type II toxin-antitoxin system VapC family toxin [Puniceicoccales bacterium CK1056]|uniref:Type II toxin-antitoxin system VapC family toxin n=1 Tax=Oceanipulchritudo coccoides TaxID=2706888 RepID=A0A6B2M5B7_9BACT|nr:type II toxin-antitoxin system VapC family toxin [Oceanipulchritudo coccoides]NDV63317.1 type II toxin-antitoxin system VapC family toxin [Oceanipulchritudo coccoides]
MKILLDTHTLIWALIDPQKLSKKAREALENSANTVCVSAISFWEISLKQGLGKLKITGASAEEFPQFCEEQGWQILPLEPQIAAFYGKLPINALHRDPFDRMLAHQAVSMGSPLVSKDKALEAYAPNGLVRLW